MFAAAVLALGGCASQRPSQAGPAPTPAERFRSLLGHNAGLNSLRAVAEASLSFAGRTVSLPGVLTLDSLGGFRLDLLDPLDRPFAILFVDGGRIIHYRPGPALAASLGVFPTGCGVDAAAWVGAVLASSVAPAAGERLEDHGFWGAGRSLERHRGAALHQSVLYRVDDGQPRARDFTWYCGDDPVMRLRPLEWIEAGPWRLPARIEIEYPKAGLAVSLDLSELEGNPAPSRQPLRPQLGTDIRWTTWNLPQ
jgi:hypothetical protein